MLLSIEDVHWLDAGSWEVLVDLIDRIGKMRVCLIMTSRMPHARPMPPGARPLDLSIQRARPLSSGEQSRSWRTPLVPISRRRLMRNLAHGLCTPGEGVPCFSGHSSITGLKPGMRGAFTDAAWCDWGSVFRVLSPDALYVLQTVALLGWHADFTMVEAVLEMPYFRVVAAIDHLHKAGAFDGEHDGFVVCHELIGRMAVDALGRNARRALHKRIAEIMKVSESTDGISPALCRARLSHLLQAGDAFSPEHQGQCARCLMLAIRCDAWCV